MSEQPFDFDAWVKLARDDGVAFEQRRRKAVEALIASAPEAMHARLHGLQFRIDLERRRARTPLKSCMRLSALMWQSVVGDNGLLAALRGQAPGQIRALPPDSARVVPLRRSTDAR